MLGNPFSAPEHAAFRWNGADSACAALMVHGFPGSPAEMRPLAQVLHRAGWTVEGLLLPGFGPDIETLPDRKYSEWLKAVQTALSQLKQEYRQVLLIGHSMGGALALQSASANSVAGLALISPFWKLDSPLWTLLPVIKIAFPTFPIFKLIPLDFKDEETRKGITRFLPDADLDDPSVQRELREFRLPIAMLDQIRLAGAKSYGSAPAVDAPTLIIQGRQDELVRPPLTHQLAGRIPGLHSIVEVDGSHDLLNPGRSAWPHVCQAVLDFAAQIQSRNTHPPR
ncbi:MAG: alpha/beta hydrolase [Aggregatilineales bacterium]